MSVTTKPQSRRAGGFLRNSGKGPTRAHGGRTRNRSKSLIVLAALLVLGFGLATAYLVTSAGDKVSVLVMGTEVSKGHVVQREDLVSQSVSGVSNAIPVDQVDDVVGRTATVDLVEGQILTDAMVTSAAVPGEGQAMVGLSLDPTRVPSSGLETGDVVDVIAVMGGDQGGKTNPADLDAPIVLTTDATVYSAEGLATDGGQLLLTLVIDEADATKVAAYSTSNLVAVVEVAAGKSS
jgi:hypothetical protein